MKKGLIRKLIVLGSLFLASCTYKSQPVAPTPIPDYIPRQERFQGHPYSSKAIPDFVVFENAKSLDSILDEEKTQLIKEQKERERKAREKFWSEPHYLTQNEVNDLIENSMERERTPPYLDEGFFERVIYAESDGNAHAVSDAGARGLTQFMENTWIDIAGTSFENAYNPIENVSACVKYYIQLDKIARRQHSEWEELSKAEKQSILAAMYNRGPGYLTRMGFDISKTPEETQKYSARVSKA